LRIPSTKLPLFNSSTNSRWSISRPSTSIFGRLAASVMGLIQFGRQVNYAALTHRGSLISGGRVDLAQRRIPTPQVIGHFDVVDHPPWRRYSLGPRRRSEQVHEDATNRHRHASCALRHDDGPPAHPAGQRPTSATQLARQVGLSSIGPPWPASWFSRESPHGWRAHSAVGDGAVRVSD